MTLSLTPDELLSTTRAVRRRLDFDRPLDLDVVRECLQLAIQAPSGSNRQGWQFVLVTDPQKKEQIADIYRKGWDIYSRSFRDRIPPEDKPFAEQTPAERVSGSAAYLAKNMQRAPVLLIPCIAGRVGSAENESRGEAGGALWLDLTRGVELYAGSPGARLGRLLDHTAPDV